MLDIIKTFIKNLSLDQPESEQDREHAIQLASSVLMVEMCRIDGHVSDKELAHLKHLLNRQFDLTAAEKQEITLLAEEALDQSTDYYQFTSILNQHFSQSDKVQLIENLWQIAFIDGTADSHEEHLLRKISSLLHISHKDFIQAKHRAEQKR
jgi:uncharacterized tellurite resistance protein B-like protein